MMGVVILSLLAYIMYEIVNLIEKILLKSEGKEFEFLGNC